MVMLVAWGAPWEMSCSFDPWLCDPQKEMALGQA